jgi:hypothetical protein
MTSQPAVAMVACMGMAMMTAVSCSNRAEPALAPPIAGADVQQGLVWGGATQVAGTRVMRVDLIRERSDFSSGSLSGEVRNILFLDPADKAGHWLLPDNRHFFSESLPFSPKRNDGEDSRPAGTVALVKTVGDDSAASTGRLLVFDAVGRIVEPVADNVRRLNAASISPSGEFVILFERNRQFVIAVVDQSTFKVKQQQPFDIPALN